MKKLILSIISFFVIASVPIVAYPIEVRITTTGCSTNVTDFLVGGTPGGTGQVNIAGNYGTIGAQPCFTITNQGTSTARVYLNSQPTYKTLVLTNAIIKNNSALVDTALKNIFIVYNHTFLGTVGNTDQQYFSLGMSGSFKRGTGTTAATGSNITLEGFGIFNRCNAAGPDCVIYDQIVNATLPNTAALVHTVGTTSASNSFVHPTPNLKDNFSCDNVNAIDQLVPGGPGNPTFPLGVCVALVPTALEIDVSLNLKGQHSLTVSSSLDQITAGTGAGRDLGQALANLRVDIQPGQFPNTINMKPKNGVIPLAILAIPPTTGSPEFPDGFAGYDPTDPDFGIDPMTVNFMGAFEYHGQGHIQDVNFDGHPDLVLHFLAPETTLACGDTLGTLTGLTFDLQEIAGSDSLVLINAPCSN